MSRFFCFAFVALFSVSSVMAQAPNVGVEARSPWALSADENWEYQLSSTDYALSGIALSLGALSQYAYRNMDSTQTPVKAWLPWDKPFVGTWSENMALASDITLWGGLVGLQVATWSGDYYQGYLSGGELGRDALMLSEVLVLNSAANLLTRSLAVWARPLVFNEESPADQKNSGQSRGSFYSGHASNAFALATYLSIMQKSRSQSVAGDWFPWVAYSLAAGVSALRVGAGKHYPSDILVGAAIGTFWGWFVPWMHRGQKPVDSNESASVLGGARASATPQSIRFVWNF